MQKKSIFNIKVLFLAFFKNFACAQHIFHSLYMKIVNTRLNWFTPHSLNTFKLFAHWQLCTNTVFQHTGQPVFTSSVLCCVVITLTKCTYVKQNDTQTKIAYKKEMKWKKFSIFLYHCCKQQRQKHLYARAFPNVFVCLPTHHFTQHLHIAVMVVQFISLRLNLLLSSSFCISYVCCCEYKTHTYLCILQTHK